MFWCPRKCSGVRTLPLLHDALGKGPACHAIKFCFSLLQIMQQLNAVTNLRVLLSEVLESSSCQAGTCSELHVAVMTENGLSLPPEVAVASLALKVSPPGEIESGHMPASSFGWG